MNKQIETAAALVAVALTTVDTAEFNASTAKFDAVVSFAAIVAASVRTVINTGSNLETDGKGRIIALVDASKDARKEFAAALIGARGLTESPDDDKRRRDCENIASMGRTVALHFVKGMIDTGSIRVAKSADEMAAFIRESVMVSTGGVETYNGLELARGRRWDAPVIEEAQADDASADVDPFAVEPSEPATAQADDGQGDETHGAVKSEETPADVLDNEVSLAIRVLQAAIQRDDMERLTAHGFKSLLTDGLAYIRATEEAEQNAAADLKKNAA